MDSAKVEHDSDSESYSSSSQSEENISNRQSDDIPMLLVADVSYDFIFNPFRSCCYWLTIGIYQENLLYFHWYNNVGSK